MTEPHPKATLPLYGAVRLTFGEDQGDPYLQLTFPDGLTIGVTLGLAELIGAAARGAKDDDARLGRYERPDGKES